MRGWILAAVAAMPVAACQATGVSSLAGVPKEQIQAAANHAETPAGLSSVQFKELGDTKRYAVMSRIIKNTWNESCQPNVIAPLGYSPNGSSRWRVHCGNSTLAYDYLITLPERSEGNARALQCYANGRLLTCNVLGRPATS